MNKSILHMLNIFFALLALFPCILSALELTEQSRIVIVSERNFIGKKITEKLRESGYYNYTLVSSTDPRFKNPDEIDLFFTNELPDFVIVSTEEAASFKGDYDEQLQKEMNCIKACQKLNVKKTLVLTSSEIFRSDSTDALKENLIYSKENEKMLSKRAQQKLLALRLMLAWNAPQCPHFILGIVPEVYGPDDEYIPTSHKAISQLIAKFHYAETQKKPFIIIQGEGKAKRECILVDDVADASLFLLRKDLNAPIVNIGYGKDISIYELAQTLKRLMHYKGNIIKNLTEDEDCPRKFLDSQFIQNMGWYPQVPFSRGIEITTDAFSKKIQLNNSPSPLLY